MDTLSSSPALLVQAELLKGVLRRSVWAVAARASVYKQQHPHVQQILRVQEAGKSTQHSSFLELIGVLDGLPFELCSVLGNNVDKSSLNFDFAYEAFEANIGECLSEGVKSWAVGQDRASRTKFLAGEDSKSTCTNDPSIVEIGTKAESATGRGISVLGEDETSSEKVFSKSEKPSSRDVGRAGTSEVSCQSEEQTTEDEKFMGEALLEAKKAAKIGEVPVGAVIVQKGRIIARAYNRVEAEGDPTAHAEMLCIRSTSKTTGDWRLTDAAIYVTVEPCPMCAGALLQARVKRVVWGARNNLLGADGSWVSLFPNSKLDHDVEEGARHVQHPFHKTVEVRREILPDDCSKIMRSFFQSRRIGKAPAAKRKPWWLSFEIWVLFRRLLG